MEFARSAGIRRKLSALRLWLYAASSDILSNLPKMALINNSKLVYAYRADVWMTTTSVPRAKKQLLRILQQLLLFVELAGVRTRMGFPLSA